MVGKNLKYALLLSGVLALTPATVGADTGRKLGGLQSAYVSLAGVQPDQATFGMIFGNYIIWSMFFTLINKQVIPAGYARLMAKYVTRFINCPDGIVGHVVSGTKDAFLTGSAEDLIKEFLGDAHKELPHLDYRKPVDKELSTALRLLCALITAGRSYYMLNKAQDILARVENECKKLEIESGITTGLAPADDGYLVIENPLKTVALGAKQAVASVAPWQEPEYEGSKFFEAIPGSLKGTFTVPSDPKDLHDKVKKAWDDTQADSNGIKRLADIMKNLNKDIPVPANAGAFNLANQLLWIPFALTHFRGRTFIPHTTFKVLPADLQQELLDLAAFNSVRHYSMMI